MPWSGPGYLWLKQGLLKQTLCQGNPAALQQLILEVEYRGRTQRINERLVDPFNLSVLTGRFTGETLSINFMSMPDPKGRCQGSGW